eukprot:14520459-Alexandrium_andersonii.AAC.1
MRKTRNRVRRSELELRGPKGGLKIGPRSSRRVRSAPVLAQTPNLPMKEGREGVRGREIATSRINRRNPWRLAREKPDGCAPANAKRGLGHCQHTAKT